MRSDRPGKARVLRAAVLVAAGLVGSVLVPAGSAAAVHGAVPGDFNGDGYRDAVLQAPGATVSGKEAAGAVVVLYGSKSGVSSARRATITQNSAGIPGAAETGDAFGAATATADLNRDGYADLVVGSPDEDTTSGVDAGSVTVLWGSKTGLSSGTTLPPRELSGYQHVGTDVSALSLGAAARTEVVVVSDGGSIRYQGPFTRSGTFGSSRPQDVTPSLVSASVGDPDGDGSPEFALASVRIGGTSGGQILSDPQTSTTLYPPPDQLGGDGLVTAFGDVDGDGYDDLVAGDPDDPLPAGTKDAGGAALGGRVLVWWGSARGLLAGQAPSVISQDTAGVPGAGEKGDAFGGSLAVADLNGDGRDEIVVGTPYETVDTNSRTGTVTVVPGLASRALGAGSYSVSQNTANVPGGSETDDFFGTTVAAGDVNGDGRPELIVSAAGENNMYGAVWVLPLGTSAPKSGGVMMLPGTVGLVTPAANQGPELGGWGLLNTI